MASNARNNGQGNQGLVQEVNICKFCSKTFARATTLAVHLCEPKRRFQNRGDQAVRLALQAFNKFFEYQSGPGRTKSFDDFETSPYYLGFVKFGRYMVDVRCVNTTAFINFVIEKNKKLDNWASDRTYDEFLADWCKREDHLDAVRRSIETMQEWADANNSVFNHYFRYATNARVLMDIRRGRVSAWCIYCSPTGQEWLGNLNPDELGLILPYVDPDWWGTRFTTRLELKTEVEYILQQAGL